jgi:hypothetical protein
MQAISSTENRGTTFLAKLTQLSILKLTFLTMGLTIGVPEVVLLLWTTLRCPGAKTISLALLKKGYLLRA